MSGPYGYGVSYAGMGALGGVSGVTASLPAGAVLGSERWEDGVKYRLFYNNGNSEIQKGRCFTRGTAGTGAYSVTVSTTTEVLTQVAGAAIHATAATGTYFWGATNGGPVSLLMSNISIATGANVAVGANGVFTKLSGDTAAVGYNLGDTTTGTGTTDAVSGRFYVFFERLSY